MRHAFKAMVILSGVTLFLLGCNRPGSGVKVGQGASKNSPPPLQQPEESPLSDRQCYAPDSTPVASGGVVCFIDSECQVHAIDARSGAELWKFKAASAVDYVPTLSSGTAFIASGALVFAIDTRTGRERWKFETQSEFHSQPTVSGQLVMFSDDGGDLHALDKTTGRERWSRRKLNKEDEVASEYIADGVAICEVGDFIVCLDAETGGERWRYNVGDSSVEIAIGGGVVCVASEDGYVYGLDARDARPAWQIETKNEPSDISVVDGAAYFKAGDRLYAVNVKTGSLKWQIHDEHWDDAYVLQAVTNGIAYAEDTGNVYAIDVSTGKKKWEFDGYSFIGASTGVCLLDRGAYIVAVDRAGQQRWKFRMPAEYGALSGAVTASGVVYIVSGKESLFGIELATGRQTWSFKLDSDKLASAPRGR